MMRTRWWVAPLVLVMAACGGDDEAASLTQADSIAVVGPSEDSIVMEPASPAPSQTAQLTGLQDSGVGGEVTIANRGAQTEFMVRLTGAPPNSEHSGSVHSGTCDAIGGVVQPLEPIQTDADGTGTMTTEINVPSMTLMDGRHVVVYHGTDGRPVTCAQIPAHAM